MEDTLHKLLQFSLGGVVFLIVAGPLIYLYVNISGIRYQVKDFRIPAAITGLIIIIIHNFNLVSFNFIDLALYLWPLALFLTGIKFYYNYNHKTLDGLRLINMALLFGVGHIMYYFSTEETYGRLFAGGTSSFTLKGVLPVVSLFVLAGTFIGLEIYIKIKSKEEN